MDKLGKVKKLGFTKKVVFLMFLITYLCVFLFFFGICVEMFCLLSKDFEYIRFAASQNFLPNYGEWILCR